MRILSLLVVAGIVLGVIARPDLATKLGSGLVHLGIGIGTWIVNFLVAIIEALPI